MHDEAKISEILRLVFLLPMSSAERHAFFLTWSDPREWNNWIRRWQRRRNLEKARALDKAQYYRTLENSRASLRRSSKKYRLVNRESWIASQKRYRLGNAEEIKSRKHSWQVSDVGRAWLREWQRQREANDLGFKIVRRLRKRIWEVLKEHDKSACTLDLLGMDLKEFRIYLQGQFLPGMTWENYGPIWHVDHVRPCASFDFSDPEQQRECFHWSNLQPLFAVENLKKGARV